MSEVGQGVSEKEGGGCKIEFPFLYFPFPCLCVVPGRESSPNLPIKSKQASQLQKP